MSATGDAHPHAAPPGFTLLEVLVVIAVLALVSGLAFPRVERAIENVQFASARSMILSAVMSARAEALRTDSQISVKPSSDGRSLLSNGKIIASLPTSIRIRSEQDELRFFGDGSATGGTIDLVSSRARAELLVADGPGSARWQR